MRGEEEEEEEAFTFSKKTTLVVSMVSNSRNIQHKKVQTSNQATTAYIFTCQLRCSSANSKTT